MVNKRKDSPSKAAVDSSKSSKRQKTTTSKVTPASKSTDAPGAVQSTLRQSNKDEPSFPRGGASVLTPLEYKEVVNEAAREVLFESKAEDAAATDTAASRKRRQTPNGRSPVKKVKKGETEDRKQQIKIEQLSYKKLSPGQLVFGFVSKITKRDVAIALPNNLIGYAPLVSISEQYTQQLQALVDRDEMDTADDDNDVDDAANDDVPALDMLFEINQPVRAYVMSVSTGNSTGEKKGRKHIELSLLPTLTNPGLSEKEIVKGSTIQASVKSIEDNGYILDLGLDFATGFMAKSDCSEPPNTVRVGRVFFCFVLGMASGGKVVQLASNFHKEIKGKIGKEVAISDAPTIDSFLPGTQVSKALITEVRDNGLVCKVMGSIDVTVDLFHSGCFSSDTLRNKYKPGKSIKIRLLATIPGSEEKAFAGSILEHVREMTPQTYARGKLALSKLPIGTIKSDAAVKHIIPGVGLILNIGLPGTLVYVHISRISDKKIDTIVPTGPYKIGSQHAVRILDYNSVDGLLLASMEEKVLAQRYIRIDDVKPGDTVKGKITRFTPGGMMVEIEEGMEAFVPEIHMSDIVLQHPEKKFREGASVKGRILSVATEQRRIKMTLKKAIVNSEGPVFADYIDVEEDEETPGTIIKLMPSGAILEFYGNVKGFLPVSEMSEAFIKDPTEHFKVGQTLNVHVISSDPLQRKVRLSCRSSVGEEDKEKAAALLDLALGSLVEGSVVEKSTDDVVVLLSGGIKGLLVLGHLTDGSKEKNLAAFKKLRAGQALVDLVVLRKDETRNFVYLTMKPSMVKAAKSGALLTSFQDVKVGNAVSGFVKDITHFGIFVNFVGGITALLPRDALAAEIQGIPNFGYQRLQSLTTYITDIIPVKERFSLSLRPPQASQPKTAATSDLQTSNGTDSSKQVTNPVDVSIKNIEDYDAVKITKARITSVKPMQLNVDLADNVKGRVEVTQVFDSWDAIKNKKHPLLKHGFAVDQEIDVKVVGIHDVKNHKYLPISHRIAGKLPTFELSTRAQDLEASSVKILSYSDIKKGSSWTAFVNNIQTDHLWVNISPSVRGRIKLLDISDNVAVLGNLEKHFPIGAALKVSVLDVDVGTGRLELTSRFTGGQSISLESLSEGMMLPGRISSISEGKVIVQLYDALQGSVRLADLSDDFDKADTKGFHRDDLLSVCVLNVDLPNKKVHLSTRPSRVLDSSSSVRDPEVKTIENVKVGKIYRGFVTNVADNGLYIHLGGTVTARARIADLSDDFVKDWKKGFKINQLVKGKVVAVDLDANQVSINLKKSAVDGTGKKSFGDYKAGDFVDGRVRKVADIGCFIVINGSDNVSGLCHKSEMSNEKNPDPHKLFAEGDLVKAKIIKVNKERGRISFGLKASYFADLEEKDLVPAAAAPQSRLYIDAGEDQEMQEGSDDDEEDDDDEEEDNDEEDGGVKLETSNDVTISGFDRPAKSSTGAGLDWTGATMDELFPGTPEVSDDEEDEDSSKKTKKKKNAIKVDMTGDLDTRDPQSADDFERLLLASPNDALLWMQYMALLISQSDIVTARAIAERALKTINYREEEAKLDIWIARLNLELAYGTPETLDVTFKNACQYNDAKKVHERLCSIYIQEKNHEKAEELFQAMTKKFSQDEKVWVNYMTYLMENGRGDQARKELARALQAIQNLKVHPELTSKFAQLEYRVGEEEKGRTVFETLLDACPKRLDLWNVYIDLEAKVEKNEEGVRKLFPRVLAAGKLSAKKAKSVFTKWVEWERRVAKTNQEFEKRKTHVLAQAEAYRQKLEEAKSRGEEVGGEDDE